MKVALARILIVISLATSLTSFATTEECKSGNAAHAMAAKQQDESATTEAGKNGKKNKKHQDRSEQEQEFDRVLMGIYG